MANQSAITEEDNELNGVLVATDPDGGSLEFALVSAPSHGTVSISEDGLFSYLPEPDFYGPDAFIFSVTDTQGAESQAAFAVDVSPVNDAPVVEDRSIETAEDNAVELILTASDIDLDPLSYSLIAQADNGTASIDGETLLYRPDLNFNGTDTIRYRVTDGQLQDEAEILVAVLGVNDPPEAVVDAEEYYLPGDLVDLDGSLSSDVEGTPLTYRWEQVLGPKVTIVGDNGATPSFEAPETVSIVELELTVSDGEFTDSTSFEVRFAGWLQVAGGSSHAVALREDYSLWTWGRGLSGQLGTGSDADRHTPTLLDNTNEYIEVAAGHSSSYALRDDGTLLAFGSNFIGELGDGTDINRSSPVVVLNGPYASVSSRGQFAVASKSDGTIWSWGHHEPYPGPLGRPPSGGASPEFDPFPGQIGTDDQWSGISAGTSGVSALRSDGTLWSWGYNDKGQLGTGTLDASGEPIRVGTRDDWQGIFRGNSTLFAQRSDGSIWSAGANRWGHLGHGTTGGISTSLEQLGADADWNMVCAGGHTIGLKNDGTIWGWGGNWDGERGDDEFLVAQGTPRRIGNGEDWVFIACGNNSTYAIKTDGSLWAWGGNRYGELGLGNTTDQVQPARVDPVR